MSAKHTPGPWSNRSRWTRCFDAIHTDGGPVCTIRVAYVDEHGKTKRWPEGEANALLIGAAPKLLDALRAMLHDDDHDAAKSQARAAIEEATGEAA